MELWKETLNKVYLEDVPNIVSATATWTKDGVSQGGLAVTEDTVNNWWTATLPYIQNECTVGINWIFSVVGSGTFTRTDSYEVITPLLTLREIRGIWADITDDKAKELESVVRYVIQSYTGQSFGKRTKSLVVQGAGDNALELPERLSILIGISTLVAELNPSAAVIVADGWYLKKKYSEPLSTVNTTNLYFEGTDYSEYGVVISPPKTVGGRYWTDDYPFTITGVWGYPAVPQAVQEAAKLLANDYACNDTLYRDRYLESIRSADWSLRFNERAYLHTGNVRADQLLDKYIMRHFGWAVI